MSKRAIALLAFVFSAAALIELPPRVGIQPDGSILIPTGQRLTPAGTRIEVDDRPLGMALSPDGSLLAVATGSNFSPRALSIIDLRREAVTQRIPIGDSFVGVAFDAAGTKLYVGGGRDNDIKFFERGAEGQFRQASTVTIPNSAPSGLALTADGRTLYAALNLKHAIAVIDTGSHAVKEVAVGSYPYTVAIAGAKVYVTNWGGRRPRPGDTTYGDFPVVLDPRTGLPSSGTVSVVDGESVQEIEVGLHPSAMAVSPDASKVYVANANSDSISVIDTRAARVSATINIRPFQGAPLGSSPNALAISRDGQRLYVANAANNAIAVVRLDDRTVQGLIPTGWYPTAVTLAAGDRKLCVASGYGLGSVASAAGKGRSYKDRAGLVSILDVPDAAHLRAFTRQVLSNNSGAQSKSSGLGHPVPMDRAGPSPIRYIFYVIKENRTFDQVFGDMPRGNGDPSLVHFGRDVTPNHHALAEAFVLLDNYYAPGDQSALGHRWCTQGYASDWLHKYSNGRNDANPMLFAPSDFLWDNAKAHDISVRSYGERGIATITPATAAWAQIYQDWKTHAGQVVIHSTPVVLGLRGIYHPRYAAFNTKVPDQVRLDEFLKEFAEFEKNGNLPRLNVLLLSQDHTAGTAPGYPTPRACVADNDLALGRLVDAISHSRYWRESAIFVTEDDAQDGLDHVDGHRTVGFVISPWTQRKAMDSTFYTTLNMYRTIEQILGLPPSNQFDLAAEPMFSVFTRTPDFATYNAIPNRIPLDEMNPPLRALRGLPRELAEASLHMDFSEPDEAPEDTLNRAIWHSVKGAAPYPALRPRSPDRTSRP